MKKENSIKRSPKWKEAEKMYTQLFSSCGTSIMGGCSGPQPSGAEIEQVLEGITQLCPAYFNAWFQKGEIMLATGRMEEGEGCYRKGLNHLLEVGSGDEEFMRVFSTLQETLEKFCYFKLLVELLDQAVEKYPDNAGLLDEMAFYMLKVPGINNTKALDMQKRAVEVDPDDDELISNLGWIYLVMDRKEEARECFNRALEFNIDNPETMEHLDLVEYLIEHDMDYNSYLTRPADLETFSRMMENVDFEGARQLVEEYNLDRLDGFKSHLLKEDKLKPHQMVEHIRIMEIYLKILDGIPGETDLPLVENHQYIHDNLGPVLLHMIDYLEVYFKEVYNTIGEVLTSFYSWLHREGKLIDSSALARIEKGIKHMVPVLVQNLEEYDQFRHDVTIPEDEKRERIRRLFGF